MQTTSQAREGSHSRQSQVPYLPSVPWLLPKPRTPAGSGPQLGVLCPQTLRDSEIFLEAFWTYKATCQGTILKT